MALENPHDDLVLTDPAVIRLVAEPTTYAVLTHLQRQGRATAGELARDLEMAEVVVDAALEALTDHGLVRPSGDVWEALGRGLLVELPADAEGQEAARLLMTRMFLEAAARPQSWWTEDEPRLPVEWRRVAGLINVGLWLTMDELQALNDRIEALTAPYAKRSEHDAPGGARRVRIQCYLMPEPD